MPEPESASSALAVILSTDARTVARERAVKALGQIVWSAERGALFGAMAAAAIANRESIDAFVGRLLIQQWEQREGESVSPSSHQVGSLFCVAHYTSLLFE